MIFMRDERLRWVQPLMFICGACSLALGFLVLAGWHTHTLSLVQVLPTFAPMQFNSALGFLLCGAGLLSLLFMRTLLATACGAAAGLIGALTLSQYLLGVELGVDQLLMESYVTVETTHPGRMAPNTALSFFLSGLALLFLGRNIFTRYGGLVAGILGVLVFGQAAVVGITYVGGVETTFGWGQLTHMAVHTAAGFALVGAGLLAAAWRKDATEREVVPRWLPIPIGISVVTVTVGLWLSLSAEHSAHIDRETTLKAEDLRVGLTELIEPNIRAVIRLAKRWEQRGGTPRDEWDADAALYVTHNPSYQAIGWVDTSFRVRWVVPIEGNERAQGLSLGVDKHQRDALQAVRDRRTVSVTRSIDLVQGGKGFRIYVPLYPGGKFDGFIVGVVLIEKLLAPFIEKQQAGYDVHVFDGETPIYHHGSGTKSHAKERRRAFELDIHGANWWVEIYPNLELLAATKSQLSIIVLVVGLLTSVILALMINLAISARRAAAVASRANGRLLEAQEQLRRERAELQLIFDSVPVRIIFKDDKNRILRLNEQAARSMGMSVKEAEGASTNDLFPAMAKKYHEDDLEVINSNTPKLGIVQEYTPKDGERGWVMTDKVPFIDEETGNRFVFASSVDITPQKQAERELQASQARFKDIAETASDWFWETDENHCFTYISRRFREITGVEPDKILGHSRFELAGGTGPVWEAHRADLQARRLFRDFKYQITNSHGETRCWSTSGKPILEEDGRFRGYRGSGSDRTIEERALQVLSKSHDQLQESVARATAELRAKTEELALALAKEKELNELQRQFVSMASHEFRTPLAIIDSTAQRLKSRADRLTPEEAIKRVDKIRHAVQRMTRLMESTLTAARMEKGKVAVEIGPCNVRKVVVEVCDRQQDIADNHLISYNFADLPETIQADPGALEQVLTNLVSNAVKYSPNAPNIEVKGFRDGIDVVISVRDHGLGIDAEDLPHMFERFFRAKTSTGIAGTGIGLNLVKALVEMHSGSVGVESEVGKGSLFTVRLPIAGPEETRRADKRAA